jgi:endonuclease/exonuclease/phosphatase family metal-dependent hydrolase
VSGPRGWSVSVRVDPRTVRTIAVDKPCGYRANDWKPTGKIDYIFLSRYDFSGTYGDATYALRSDHTPLWAWTNYV